MRMYDVVREESSKTPCLIFEYIPNIETKQITRSFNHLDIRLYIYKILEALDYAHSHGIMHRDIKSDNIMITNELNAVLIDFSLAKIINGPMAMLPPGSTHTGEIGTATYAAPEVVNSEPYVKLFL